MTHRASLILMLGFAGLLSACQISAPGGTDVTANAVAGDRIEVSALDAPAAGALAPPPAGLATAAPQDAEPTSAAADPAAGPATGPATGPVPAPIPGDDAAEGQGGAAGVDPVLATEPEPLPDAKSDRQLACERKDGQWVTAVGSLKACVFPTGESGKRCTKESQCKGVCLARSGTCAPVKPLYGCNEVLQDNGARVTLCLE